MAIRNAKAADLAEIAEIYDQAYDEVKDDPNFGDFLRLKRPDSKRMSLWRKRMAGELKSRSLIYIVAEERGRVVGFCFVKQRENIPSEISHVCDLGIRVSKKWRGKGIGKALMKKIIQKARGRFEIINLFVFSNNMHAKNLYRKFGFKRWGIAPHYVKRGKRYFDAEYMYKVL